VCSAVHDSTAVRDCAALDLEDEAFAIGNAASAAGDAALEEARVRPVPGIADRVKSGQCRECHFPGLPWTWNSSKQCALQLKIEMNRA
jgi:hypothetical protein